jgi:hypothetical protein
LTLLVFGFASRAGAADIGFDALAPIPAAPEFGVPCAIGQPFWYPPAPTAEDFPWRSVWLGHFSGGRPFVDPYGRTLIDWRDEKVCFVSKSHCQVWISHLRANYDRPEGDWTCMFLR